LGETQITAPIIQRTKVIVDKDASTITKMESFHEDVFQTVKEALISVPDGHATIRVTSNLYEEKIEVNTPGIEIRPREKGGEVTI